MSFTVSHCFFHRVQDKVTLFAVAEPIPGVYQAASYCTGHYFAFCYFKYYFPCTILTLKQGLICST